MKHVFLPLLVTTLLSACAVQHGQVPLSFLGSSIAVTDAENTVEIHPDTRWVNVDGGETYRFVIGDKAFGWAFDAPNGPSSFDLRRIAPAGMLHRSVTVYVAPDPKYTGDGGIGFLFR